MQKKRPDKGRASACPSAPRDLSLAGKWEPALRREQGTRRGRGGLSAPPTDAALRSRTHAAQSPRSAVLLRSHHSDSHRTSGLGPHRACPGLPGKPPVGTSWRPKPHAHPPRSAAHARLGTASILRGVAAGSGAGALRPKTTMSDWSCQASDLRPKPGSLREVGEEQTPQTARLHRLPWARGRAARLTLASSQRAPHASARTPHGRLTPR